jgi:hypothetical protein
LPSSVVTELMDAGGGDAYSDDDLDAYDVQNEPRPESDDDDGSKSLDLETGDSGQSVDRLLSRNNVALGADGEPTRGGIVGRAFGAMGAALNVLGFGWRRPVAGAFTFGASEWGKPEPTRRSVDADLKGSSTGLNARSRSSSGSGDSDLGRNEGSESVDEGTTEEGTTEEGTTEEGTTEEGTTEEGTTEEGTTEEGTTEEGETDDERTVVEAVEEEEEEGAKQTQMKARKEDDVVVLDFPHQLPNWGNGDLIPPQQILGKDGPFCEVKSATSFGDQVKNHCGVFALINARSASPYYDTLGDDWSPLKLGKHVCKYESSAKYSGASQRGEKPTCASSRLAFTHLKFKRPERSEHPHASPDAYVPPPTDELLSQIDVLQEKLEEEESAIGDRVINILQDDSLIMVGLEEMMRVSASLFQHAVVGKHGDHGLPMRSVEMGPEGEDQNQSQLFYFPSVLSRVTKGPLLMAVLDNVGEENTDRTYHWVAFQIDKYTRTANDLKGHEGRGRATLRGWVRDSASEGRGARFETVYREPLTQFCNVVLSCVRRWAKQEHTFLSSPQRRILPPGDDEARRRRTLDVAKRLKRYPYGAEEHHRATKLWESFWEDLFRTSVLTDWFRSLLSYAGTVHQLRDDLSEDALKDELIDATAMHALWDSLEKRYRQATPPSDPSHVAAKKKLDDPSATAWSENEGIENLMGTCRIMAQRATVVWKHDPRNKWDVFLDHRLACWTKENEHKSKGANERRTVAFPVRNFENRWTNHITAWWERVEEAAAAANLFDRAVNSLEADELAKRLVDAMEDHKLALERAIFYVAPIDELLAGKEFSSSATESGESFAERWPASPLALFEALDVRNLCPVVYSTARNGELETAINEALRCASDEGKDKEDELKELKDYFRKSWLLPVRYSVTLELSILYDDAGSPLKSFAGPLASGLSAERANLIEFIQYQITQQPTHVSGSVHQKSREQLVLENIKSMNVVLTHMFHGAPRPSERKGYPLLLEHLEKGGTHRGKDASGHDFMESKIFGTSDLGSSPPPWLWEFARKHEAAKTTVDGFYHEDLTTYFDLLHTAYLQSKDVYSSEAVVRSPYVYSSAAAKASYQPHELYARDVVNTYTSAYWSSRNLYFTLAEGVAMAAALWTIYRINAIPLIRWLDEIQARLNHLANNLGGQALKDGGRHHPGKAVTQAVDSFFEGERLVSSAKMLTTVRKEMQAGGEKVEITTDDELVQNMTACRKYAINKALELLGWAKVSESEEEESDEEEPDEEEPDEEETP